VNEGSVSSNLLIESPLDGCLVYEVSLVRMK
jgi:hypothetical protein